MTRIFSRYKSVQSALFLLSFSLCQSLLSFGQEYEFLANDDGDSSHQLDHSYYYDYDYSEDHSSNQKDDPCVEFCYSSSNKCCGFSSGLWGSICRSGKQQSPIALPNCGAGKAMTSKILYIDPDIYKGKFTLENDGHTVILQFQEKNKTVDFSGNGKFAYTFDSVRFHWGKDDKSGSEHCFKRSSSDGSKMRTADDKCPRESMEIQLVHYKSDKKDLKAAISSGQQNALVIVSILLRVTNASLESPTIVPVLNPVTKHLNEIYEFGTNASVKSTFDLTPFLNTPNLAATYPGSLTTPMCKQVVKWYVLQEPFAVRSQDIAAFRMVTQANGKPLLGNRRPLQKKNKRTPTCLQVKMKHSGEAI